MNPAIEQAVADAIPHASPAIGLATACTTGNCWCGAEKRRNVLLTKLATANGNVYGRRVR